MRIAWFSPMPPSRSGIAAYSEEILPLLRLRQYEVDVFVERAPLPGETAVFSAHDFVWMQRRQPYDLTIYQMGNATCHGYMWAYLLRYPGLLVLHDAQLHQARALWLMKRARPRYDDYIAEFRATEPGAPPDAAYLIAAGLGESAFYQRWPLVRLVLERSRLSVVHDEWLRTTLAERYPDATIDAIEMGVADPLATAGRRTLQDGDDSRVVIAAFGGVTPEKRIASLLRALAGLRDRVPSLRLLLVGEEAEHYDVRADAARYGVADRVDITGYVPDAEVPAYLASADICSCLRWPTNRETSASWLRCLAAGKPTLVTALAQHARLPDVAVRIDILDEEQALPGAIERLALNENERVDLGQRARQHWEAHHQLSQMADGYERVIARARGLPAPRPALPAHMDADGSDVLRTLARDTGLAIQLADLLRD